MNINKIRSFGEWLSDKENPMVYCLLSLDGEPFLSRNSYEVILEQKTNAHDTFSIIVPDDALDTYEGFVMENSKKLLGKKISYRTEEPKRQRLRKACNYWALAEYSAGKRQSRPQF